MEVLRLVEVGALLAQLKEGWVPTGLARRQAALATRLEEALCDPLEEAGQLPLVPRRSLQLLFYRRKKECLCSNITIMKLRAGDEAVPLFDGTATLYGCLIVCIGGILSVSCLCCHQSE